MTKITLVRIDGDEKHEVNFSYGETIIGRGPMMQCADKRVSRRHAVLNVSDDGKIVLTSTSLNPCYYNNVKVITKSCSVELKPGDQFSFLQDSYCYYVKVSPDTVSSTDERPCSSDVEEPVASAGAGLNDVSEDGSECAAEGLVTEALVHHDADDVAEARDAASVCSVGDDMNGEALVPDGVDNIADTTGEARDAVSLCSVGGDTNGEALVPGGPDNIADTTSEARDAVPSCNVADDMNGEADNTADSTGDAEDAGSLCSVADDVNGEALVPGEADDMADPTSEAAGAISHPRVVKHMSVSLNNIDSDSMDVVSPSSSVMDSLTVASLGPARKYIPEWLIAATKRALQGEETSSEEPPTKKAKATDNTNAAEADQSLDVPQGSDGGSNRRTNTTVRQPVQHQMSDDSDAEEPSTLDPAPTQPTMEVQRAEVRQSEQPTPGAHEMSDNSETEEPSGQARAPTQPTADVNKAGGGTGQTVQSSGDPTTPAASSSAARDPCKYGSSCYRKNSKHRADFSHPGDADYKEDKRAECPYGTSCYRKNPLHKQNYKHTKKPEKPPKKRQQRKKGGPANADADSDEDDYDYDDPFLNDGSSDDYEPTDSGSDESASEGEKEEDLKRTKKEAKRFTRGNRKR